MRLVVVIAAALLLTGCTSTPTAKPAHTVNPNAAACSDIVTASAANASDIQGGNDTADEYAAVRGQFDAAGLKATGDVKTRIESLVSAWPDFAGFALFRTGAAQYNTALDDIARACEASGAPITVTHMPTQ